MRRINKKGVSVVVEVILVLLLTIAAVSIVAGFIVPMVKNWLKSTECFDNENKIKIDSASEYTCYNPVNMGGNAQISIELGDINISEIAVSIYSGGSSEVYRLKNGEAVNGVRMLDNSAILSLPNKGEERTYVFNKSIAAGTVKASVAVVVNGRLCGGNEQVLIEKCA